MLVSLIADPSPDDGLPPQCRTRHPSTLDRCDLQEHPADVPHWHRWGMTDKGYTWPATSEGTTT